MLKITCLSLLALVTCKVYSETGTTDALEQVFSEQRKSVINLAPFILETECVIPSPDGKTSVHNACSLIACQDGRFIIHRKSDSNVRESRAWDGNGLYYQNTTSDNTDFLPKAAFDTQFDTVVDPLVHRKVPMADLLLAFSGAKTMDGASVAIPCGPLLVFDYMMSLDRFCTDRPARLNIRW